MAFPMRRCVQTLAIGLLAALPCVPADAGDGMFLKLNDIFSFENHSTSKAEFPDGSTFEFDCDRFVSERGVISHRDRPALVVRVVCECSGRPRRGTVVWLYGGPFHPIPETVTAEQGALLSLGYDLIIPVYPGSAGRQLDVTPLGVTPNFDDAIAETEVAVRVAQREGGRVVLVGDSFGSLLAAAAAKSLRRQDRLVLSRLMLKSYHALLPPEGNQVAAPIAIDGVVATDKSLEEQSALANETFDRFGGPWLDRDVISILKPKPPRNLLVIYRERDPKSSVERMPELLALGAGRYRTLQLPGAEHEEVDTRPLLDRFIREVESWDEGAAGPAAPSRRPGKQR
jgi:pimeloyl-ACP methyl ester carboxylesterase